MMRWINRLFGGWKQSTDHPKGHVWIADVSIAGLQHYRGNDLAELIKEDDTLELIQQPDNPHDSHAIMVMWHHNKIGYVPRALAREISRQMAAGTKITATIIELKPVRYGRKWIKIRLEATAST
ncbi:MAG: restriction endonuclease [Gammaproteobacteria bacterium]|nr:MAG: restriction endonuclease [Gammaproteobacteria bacterium]